MKYPAFFLACVALLSAQTDAPAPATVATTAAPVTSPAVPAPPAEQVLALPEPGRFKPLFQPFRTEIATLSPDGKYLAYTVRDKDTVNVAVIEVDHPEKMHAYVQVLSDEQATAMLVMGQAEPTPARINWMKWVSPTRLVAETNQTFSRAVGADSVWNSWRGSIIAFDADGANAKTIATPFDLEDAVGSDFATPGSRSTQRGAMLGRTPDQAAEELVQDTPLSSFAETTTAAEDFGGAGMSDVTMRPRELRVFDLDYQTPGAVTFVSSGASRTAGNQWIGLYTLDALTGKMKPLADDLSPSNQDVLLDRQGHIRIGINNSKLAKFPFRYDYFGLKGKNRAKPLDDTIALAPSSFTVSPNNFFSQRAIPLGFDEDPNILYYASNLGRDTFGVYSFNLATNERGKLALENPAFDLVGAPDGGFPDARLLVFDRYKKKLAGIRYENAMRTTVWLNPDWNQLQAGLEKRFPGRSVEIIDWDQTENRFLFTTQGPGDPGAFFIYDAKGGRLSEFVRRAPWVEENRTLITLPFSYKATDGARISGLVTVPNKPRLKPIPMVVLCPDLPWQRVRSSFQTDVQALADMGFVVVQLNGRGAWGLGVQQRQSLTKGYDLVQVDDIITTLANLEKIFQVNPRRVAVMGRGHGGFIALRAVQDHPDKFRCAIAIDAPVDLKAWLEEQRWSTDDPQTMLRRAWLGDDARLAAKPLTSAPEKITKPILMLNYPGLEGEMRTGVYARARQFAGAVRKQGVVADFADLRTDYIRGLPGARSEVFEQIEGFLNQHVYTYNVKIGETVFKDEPTR